LNTAAARAMNTPHQLNTSPTMGIGVVFNKDKNNHTPTNRDKTNRNLDVEMRGM
jgi:flagellar basal body rod protein FlgG